VNALRSLAIAFVGKRKCAYSVEANALLVSAAAVVGGAEAVTSYWLEDLPKEFAAQLHAALKKEVTQTTVPYVFINGEFIGGCDATKAHQAAGTLSPKIYAAASAHGLTMGSSYVIKAKKAAPESGIAAHQPNGHAQEHALVPDETFYDPGFKPAVGDETPRAYPPLFWFPEVGLMYVA
jgi:glutaredoxin